MLLIISGSKGQDTTIRWDSWGVPHIDAKNQKKAYYAFGWAQMKANANLILRLYGKARGRAAEYWGGEPNIESDLQVWKLDIPDRAEKWFGDQPAFIKEYLGAFVKGMNDFARKHPESIHGENYLVLPLKETDPLVHLQLYYHVMVGAFALNQQVESWSNAGSNAWALAPSRSISGNPLLLIQPHPPWIDTFHFFEAQLKSPNNNLYGIAQVGSPSIVMGFNENLGWGLTFNQADSFDLIELQVEGDSYQFNGSWKNFEIKEISIKIKSKKGFVERDVFIKKSVFGLVVSEDENRALALRISGLDKPNMFSQFYEMGNARNAMEFEKALSQLQLPLQNIIFSDKNGNIGYVYNGLIPKRPGGLLGEWSQIIPASKPGALVTNYHSYEELPKIMNPKSGFIANSNNSPWSSTYPSEINSEDYPDYFALPNFDLRSRRSLNMILSKDRHSFEDLVRMQSSSHSELADLVLDDLVRLALHSNNSVLRSAGEILQNWDRTLSAKSKGAVLFIEWYREAQRNGMFSQDIPFDQPMPSFQKTDEIKEALYLAARKVNGRYGALDVSFGEVYKVPLSDGQSIKGGLGLNEVGSFSAGFYRQAESGQYFLLGGTAFSSVIEFGSKIRAKGLLSYGNFTEPSQFNSEKQIRLLIDGRLRDILFYREDILKNTVEVEKL